MQLSAMTIMVQGTASSVGKSAICTGLCRVLRQDGIRVVPFKSQNMSTKSFTTAQGDEISTAQALQAVAAGLEPTVHMNPVLLKPMGDRTSEVVLLGKGIGRTAGAEYRTKFVDIALEQIQCSFDMLARDYDVVVIEGAGSPAEVNLRDRDICNMRIARMADAPVILVGNVDVGGVLAAIVGTLELLEPDERDRVKGLVINKFRGDYGLLKPGLDFLAAKTGKPVLGVVPYIRGLNMVEEDSLGDGARGSMKDQAALDALCDTLADCLRQSMDIDEIKRMMRSWHSRG